MRHYNANESAGPRRVNLIHLQSVNTSKRSFRSGGAAMLIYPVPVEVTKARVQLLAHQMEKAPPRVLNEAVLDVFAAKNKVERDAVAVDIKA